MNDPARQPFNWERPHFVGPITALRPDETLYSWISRTAYCLGSPSRSSVSQLLFGGALPRYSADLPNGLSAFVRESGQTEMSVEELALATTNYGYFANFLELETTAALLDDMAATATHTHSRLGLDLRRVTATRLRYCPVCHETMDRRHGGRWWRRAHQLPSSLVCPDHKTGLRESHLTNKDLTKGFWLPTAENCPDQPDPLSGQVGGEAAEKLQLLAWIGVHYLQKLEGKERASWAEHYAEKLPRIAGYRNGPRAMVEPVHSELVHFLKGVPTAALGLDLLGQEWVYRLLTPTRKAEAPVGHIILQAMIAWHYLETDRFERSGRTSF